jgi:DNA-binding beta-propeller fold protein YncE
MTRLKTLARIVATGLMFALPASAALAKDTGYLFVSSENDNAVTVLDGRTHPGAQDHPHRRAAA